MKKSNVPTLGETVRLTARCVKDINAVCPGLVSSYLLCSVFSSLSPCVIAWFSAQIINELAGARRP